MFYHLVFYQVLTLCLVSKALEFIFSKNTLEKASQRDFKPRLSSSAPQNLPAGDSKTDFKPSKDYLLAFFKFKWSYLAVYLLAVLSDWLQGPYVYALYDHYHYEKAVIGQLYIVGFASSAIFGSFIAALADKFGRKKLVLFYCICYTLSCLTKHSPDFWALFWGRVLGGIAYSILFSAFESWLVCQHSKEGYDEVLLSDIFAKAQFGNGLVAVCSGQIGHRLVGRYGAVAPFDAAIIVLSVTAVVVWFLWDENYGNSDLPTASGLKTACNIFFTDKRILLLGLIQSSFEGAMYTFTFIWTPALQTAHQNADLDGLLPHGIVFSSFMGAMMIGTSLFTIALRYIQIEMIILGTLFISSFCFFLAITYNTIWTVLPAFLLFEVCCGIYFPAFSTLRSPYIPEENRTAILNIFRIPLNIIVVITLYYDFTNLIVFKICFFLLNAACVFQVLLNNVIDKEASKINTLPTTEKEAVI